MIEHSFHGCNFFITVIIIIVIIIIVIIITVIVIVVIIIINLGTSCSQAFQCIEMIYQFRNVDSIRWKR